MKSEALHGLNEPIDSPYALPEKAGLSRSHIIIVEEWLRLSSPESHGIYYTNHDAFHLLNDYISNKSYIYDDNFNLSPVEDDSIQELLAHPLVDASCSPSSEVGQLNNCLKVNMQRHILPTLD